MWPSLSESVSILCYILSSAREKTKGTKQNYKETWIDLRYTHREESKWFSWMRVLCSFSGSLPAAHLPGALSAALEMPVLPPRPPHNQMDQLYLTF